MSLSDFFSLETLFVLIAIFGSIAAIIGVWAYFLFTPKQSKDAPNE